jgi:O-antigen/teichoic acid export membrane protein
VLGLATGTFVARLLGPQGRGELAAIQLWATLLLFVSELGMSDALVYFSARDPRWGLRYLATALIISLGVCVPVMVMAYAAMPVLLSTQSNDVVAAARVYLLLLPVNVLMLSSHILRGRGDFRAWNAARLIAPVVWLAVLLSSWGLGLREPRLLAFLYLMLFAVASAPILVLVVRHYGGRLRPEAAKARPLLSYGFACLLSAVPRLFSSRLDQVVIAAFLPAQTLGLYVVAVSWSMLVSPLASSVGSVVSPRVASQGDHDRQRQVFAQASRATVLVSLLVAVGAMACTPLVLPFLFGRSFAPAIPTACILLGATAMTGVNDTLGQGLRGFGRPSSAARAEFAGAIANGGGLWLLLWPLGITGAALASVLGSATIMLIATIQVARITGYRPALILIPTRHDVELGYHRLQSWIARTQQV